LSAGRLRGPGNVSKYVLDQLPSWKPLFGDHGLPLRDAGAVFVPGGQASQHLAVCRPDPGRPARLHSAVDEPVKKPTGFRRFDPKAINYAYLGIIFAIGLTGLLLYNFGLSNAHPIIISAILNLSPFWAALVALVLAGVPIPISQATFFGCFAGAFIGAMAVAWSQLGDAGTSNISALADSFVHGSWLYAIPVPLASALGGTLVGKWFGAYDESAAIAANFLTANVILIPGCLALLYWRNELNFDQLGPILLMIFGTIVAASLGRVMYQIALTVTGGDNGFVTMFLNLVPALTAFISLGLSHWVPDLHFVIDLAFFLGSGLIAASLVLFSLKSWRQPAQRA